jgi:polynucleotide 5'-hydroxyl-kinase GRC3/NOL9
MPNDAPPPLPDEWQPGLDALRSLPDGAAAFLVGATDRGKTTFAAAAARSLSADVERVAVVDADIGQSEIGPPGTVGVAWARSDAAKLTDLKPAGVFFVGAFAPPPVALELVSATGRAAQWARSVGAKRLLVDTTGFVAGPAARRLKVYKAQAVAPALIVGVARGGEIDGLLAALSAATGAAVVRLPVPDVVGRKSTTFRATRRMTRLSRALEAAREIGLPLADVSTIGATLGTGEPVTPELVRWAANALRLPVVYAERSDGTLTLFLRGGVPRRDWEAGAGPVADHFKVRTVHALSLAHHADAYLGMHDAKGRLLSVGRFVGLDTDRSEIIAAVPPPITPERVRLVAFGRVRVHADGSPQSVIRPGEI